ncbi:beta-ketoacyl synthase N-terminal-like domain-containing protein [Pseudomonas sp. KNUC1026]|uniref:beta-ketoacyl synthase N-terminal-like domain-containing protein n=1 Tax=Pseudomonas sp. KNUC1026 TaxID=2893890 RepID=UPI001F2CBF39|nr:beta-ketoacyl synthase N-terminal-like domain-containing protein [Pseudomonas sp. KNUC1026]UFH50201.1 hypothetical protein LN139_02430 [Pseudomonas sp. KNUC1026]
MSNSVVVTGVSAIGPLGATPRAILDNCGFLPERSGTGRTEETPRGNQFWLLEPMDFSACTSARTARKLDKFCLLGLAAAQQALAHAQLCGEALEPEAVGLFIGNNLGGWGYIEKELRLLHTQGVKAMSPYVATAWFPAALQGQLSLKYGFTGHSKTFSSRDVAGLQALGYAAQAIRAGRIQVAVCGAAEDLSSDFVRAVLDQDSTATGNGRNRGQCFSEGGAFLILESEAHALARGARPLARVDHFSDRFAARPADLAPTLAHSLAPHARAGQAPVLFIGETDDAALHAGLQQAYNAAGRAQAYTYAQPALGTRFSLNGVLEAALACHEFQHAGVPGSLLEHRRADSEFHTVVIPRTTSQGNVTCLGMSRY